MNGRLYDAKLDRFLAPDNFVQSVFDTQSYNRYGYVLNNPLLYSDPSGEVIVAMIIGAFINIAIQGLSSNINSIGDFLLAGAIGALSGLAGAGLANLAVGANFFSTAAINTVGFGMGATVGAATGLGAGFVGGAGNAWMNGASFGEGLAAGIKAGVMGAFTGAAVGGVIGGIRARKQGLDFWKGPKRIVNAKKFNSFMQNLVDDGGAEIASLDSDGIGMFQDGESLVDFKANLSGDDWYSQSLKAYKKAFWHARHNNPLRMDEIIDFDTIGGNGWKRELYNSIYKEFEGFGAGKIGVSFSIEPDELAHGIRYVESYQHFSNHSAFLLGTKASPVGSMVFPTAYDTSAHALFYNYIKLLP